MIDRYFKETLRNDERVRQAFFDYHDAQLFLRAQEWLDEEEIDAELVPYQSGGKY